MKKSEISRRMSLLAGRRPPLPGHDYLREITLRTELAECFEPVNTMELLWVADIAYCTAAIELYRAHIAGLRMLYLRQAFEHERKDKSVPGFPECSPVSMYSTDEQTDLDRYAEQNFVAHIRQDMQSEMAFAILLGSMSAYDIQKLRQLQQLLHDETRERDRLVNQIDRRRRQAMRDAIELAEARQRAADYEAQCKAREEQGGAATGAENAPAVPAITTSLSSEEGEGAGQEAA